MRHPYNENRSYTAQGLRTGFEQPKTQGKLGTPVLSTRLNFQKNGPRDSPQYAVDRGTRRGALGESLVMGTDKIHVKLGVSVCLFLAIFRASIVSS